MDAFGRSDKKKERDREREERPIFLVKRGNGSSRLLTELIERRIIFEALFASGF